VGGQRAPAIESWQPLQPVVVAPTYNNARTLPDLLMRLESIGVPVIVVNDGSTDETPRILADWMHDAPDNTLVSHRSNQGKGAALRSGFAQAEHAGFTHAVTIDTDGQHDPEEIPTLLTAALKSPAALILGCRSTSIHEYPASSLMGGRLSNLAIWLESGRRPSDSQSGFRVYPLELVRNAACFSNRYGFETEIITRGCWAGCEFKEVPVTSRYLPPATRVSHFRPFRDTLDHILMHLRLLGSRAAA